MSFQVGDRVKRIRGENRWRMELGDIGTVSKVSNYGDWIALEEFPVPEPFGDEYPWAAVNFELFESNADRLARLEQEARVHVCQQDIQLEDPPEDRPLYAERSNKFQLECLYCGETYSIRQPQDGEYIQCKYCKETKLLKIRDKRQEKGDVFGYQCQG